MIMLRFFEKKLDAFPDDRFDTPPAGVLAFVWHYTKDARTWVGLVSATSAIIAVGEVALFAFLGQFVDWLTQSNPETFIAENGGALLAMLLFIAIALPVFAVLNALFTFQVISGNMPMSARWRMHRLLLGQSVSFFSNEFAGRVSTKVMQTALAIREVVMKVLDVLVYVGVYFAAMIAVIGMSDWRLVAPLGVWLLSYIGMIYYFVPRLAETSKRQADARSTMTGRIVDSYTNINTVKLFAHTQRETQYAKDGMTEFLGTVHPQMRLVTLFYSTVYISNCLTILAVGGLSIWLWSNGFVSVGAIAVAIALTLRIFGMSSWVMWEVSALFETLGSYMTAWRC